MEPILIDENGVKWYSMQGIALAAKRTPERLRQLTKGVDPLIIKDNSRGIILFRLADGWKFAEKGGIKKETKGIEQEIA